MCAPRHCADHPHRHLAVFPQRRRRLVGHSNSPRWPLKGRNGAITSYGSRRRWAVVLVRFSRRPAVRFDLTSRPCRIGLRPSRAMVAHVAVMVFRCGGGSRLPARRCSCLLTPAPPWIVCGGIADHAIFALRCCKAPCRCGRMILCAGRRTQAAAGAPRLNLDRLRRAHHNSVFFVL